MSYAVQWKVKLMCCVHCELYIVIQMCGNTLLFFFAFRFTLFSIHQGWRQVHTSLSPSPLLWHFFACPLSFSLSIQQQPPQFPADVSYVLQSNSSSGMAHVSMLVECRWRLLVCRSILWLTNVSDKNDSSEAGGSLPNSAVLLEEICSLVAMLMLTHEMIKAKKRKKFIVDRVVGLGCFL